MNTEALLLKHDLQPTAMRILVLKFLQTTSTAVSLNDMFGAFENADRTTLYRTLKSFEEKGIVHSIIDTNGITKYALCHADCDVHEHNDAHIHFYCKKCEQTYCLPKFTIPSFELPKNFQKQETRLLVEGICDSCG
ncbi:MAG: Fur family ferric uptake transcriptional regulator [Marivirga sp.]|jgi:Fur family ferric uptake transcriptional regulator